MYSQITKQDHPSHQHKYIALNNTNGLVHDPCWQPGNTWHSLHVLPDQPKRQRHSPGASQYPRVEWQSLRQMALMKMYPILISSFNFIYSTNCVCTTLTYVQNRKDHPSLCYKHTQTTRYRCRVDNRATVCIVRIDHRRSPNCSDIHRDACNILVVDHILCGILEHRTNHLANLLIKIGLQPKVKARLIDELHRGLSIVHTWQTLNITIVIARVMRLFILLSRNLACLKCVQTTIID